MAAYSSSDESQSSIFEDLLSEYDSPGSSVGYVHVLPRGGRGHAQRGRPRGAARRGGRGLRGVRGGGVQGQRRGVVPRDNPGLRAQEALDLNREQMKEKVLGMSQRDLIDLLVKFVDTHPSLALELMTATPGRPDAPPNQPVPDWCTCGQCRGMRAEVERLCCGRSGCCVTGLPYFHVLVLDEAVLALARLYRQEMFALPVQSDHNKGCRHTAYTQYTLWQHGKLGLGIRRVIPSCAVWAIRDKYPDAFNVYTGFIPSRLG